MLNSFFTIFSPTSECGHNCGHRGLSRSLNRAELETDNNRGRYGGPATTDACDRKRALPDAICLLL